MKQMVVLCVFLILLVACSTHALECGAHPILDCKYKPSSCSFEYPRELSTAE